MKQIVKLLNVSTLKPVIYAVLILLCGGMAPVNAAFDPVNDDTDIFLTNPNNPANRPNVLIILDNTANWSRNVGGQAIFINEKSALVDVVSNLSDEFNIGLQMFTETGGGNSGDDGGYVRFGIRQMTSTNRTVLANMVGGLDQNGDKSNNNVVALNMFEAYRYYAGKASRSSVQKAKTDFNGSTINLAKNLGNHPLNANTAGTLFNSPITADSCAQNFIIFISNGPANENSNALGFSQTELSSLGYNTSSTIAITPNGQQGNWMDEWADYMANADINGTGDNEPHVYTYVVEVDPGNTGQAPAMTALLQSTANKGKGKYFAVSSTNAGQGITNALNQIFQEIQAVNSVFASTTLPVSVNVRGTNLNQVYIGVFRPDENKSPRWYGNLKAYQLGFDQTTSVLFLADKNGDSAENTTTGFINPDAESFWTKSSSFWGFRQAEQNGTGGASDLPDGDLVEKGGAAQQLREDYATDQSTRNLYTCTSGGSDPCIGGDSLSDTPFDTTNDGITDANLGLGTTLVSSLTALDTLTVNSLTDTRTVTAASTTTGTTVIISNLDNGSVTRTLTSLTTAPNKTITAMTNNPVVKTITSLNRGTGGSKNIATAVVNSHGYTTGQLVTIANVSAAEYNGTFTITVVDSNTFTYDTGNANPTNNPNISAPATASTTSTLVTVTVASHGFTSGNQVTIAGVTPSSFNGTYTITSTPTTDTFRFVTASALAPVTSVAGATASSGGTTATATTSVAHGYSVSDSVTISGATPAGFNGTFTILSVPTTTTFTFNAGSSLGTASTPGSVAKGGTTVTATTSAAHGYSDPADDGTIITITGAVPNGYNGTYAIDVTGANTFTYTKAGLAPWDSSSAPQFIAGINSTTVTATIDGHGFGAPGDTVTIDVSGANDNLNSPSLDYNGTGISATVVDANTLTYATQNGGTPDSATGTITARLSTPTAIGTIPAHGFTTGDLVTISGVSSANAAAYNLTNVAVTVVNTNTFQYPITAVGAPHGDATGTIMASIKTLIAKARVVGHGLTTGDTVTIAGASPTAFNGTFTVTVPPGDPDNFTYTLLTKQGAATGTIVATTGSASAVANDVIAWVRGADNKDDEDSDGTNGDIRASVHGDVLHSRPAVVNYNRHGNDNDVYIFYGSNDGVFRAVKGGFAQSDVSEPMPGEEAWGFIPEEHFFDLERLRNNEPIISSSNKKPYFADGSLGVYVNDANNDGILDPANSDSDDKVYLYISMHRGGRFIYALDVSDPSDPKFLWKKSSSDWTELGQTWSTPFVTTINAQADPVLIFGAGYDPLVEDVDPATITAVGSTTVTAGAAVYTRSMGRGIMVVDAFTGDLIFQAGPAASDNGAADDFLTVAGMTCSIPGDAAVLTDRAGSVDNRAYFGDTCGNVWRLDMGDADPGNWVVTKLADLADESDIPAGLRKFLFPPDVVYGDNFDAVLIGSGDREHPFDEDVVNRFYMVRDLGTSTTAATTNITEADLFDATSNCLQSSSSCSGTGDEADQATAAAALDAGDGWFITLAAGEKVVGNSVTLNNVTFFNTNQPSTTASTTCTSNLGIARQYQVNFDDATAYKDKNLDGNVDAADRSIVHPGGGYLPSPVPVVVQIDGQVHEGVISGVKVEQPPGSLLGARLRKFWFKEFE